MKREGLKRLKAEINRDDCDSEKLLSRNCAVACYRLAAWSCRLQFAHNNNLISRIPFGLKHRQIFQRQTTTHHASKESRAPSAREHLPRPTGQRGYVNSLSCDNSQLTVAQASSSSALLVSSRLSTTPSSTSPISGP